ncbi:hypothetical protein CRG98_012164 [Punica granatum]|uniref:Uncharacterized protein n=1 Tax=Punica granatum TaxID=22663 RepID=A0A2I0KG05_PUNGR|nr:hypothetical protein CRG98_012164 [Punica granatum]
MRPRGKVDTPKPRDLKACNAGPDESPHSSPYRLPLGHTPIPNIFFPSNSRSLLEYGPDLC